jgi:hypothetical protein
VISDFCEQLSRRVLVELFGETWPRELGGVIRHLIDETDDKRLRQRQGEAKVLLRMTEIIDEERKKY